MSPSAQQLPEQVSAEREQGLKLYQAGDVEGAIKTLRIATRKFKEDGMAWHYLGLSLNRRGNIKDARKAFEKAVKLLPNFPPAHNALAYALLSSNKADLAENEAQKTLTLDAANPHGHYILGAVQLRKGHCAEAKTHAEAARVSTPEFALAYLLKSQATICEIAESSFKPFDFHGTIFRTAAPAQEVSDEDRRTKAKRTASRFRDAAETLEKFLQLEPNTTDAAMWKDQLESLRVYAEPADKTESERSTFVSYELTTKAHILAKPEPVYTELARSQQITGTVILRAVLAADGTVKHLLILSSLPAGLTQQALSAAKKIKFIPASKDGRPVSTYVQLEYNFNLY
ncbi:MAG: TonB family protein [Pyrinomonadaceae bacterium]